MESAAEFIRRLNPDVQVTHLPLRFDRSNALELLADWDLVVNGCDNFPTRYLVNDACWFAGKPLYGRLLLFDALSMEFRGIRLDRNPNCSLCGARPTVTALIDYEQFCAQR